MRSLRPLFSLLAGLLTTVTWAASSTPELAERAAVAQLLVFGRLPAPESPSHSDATLVEQVELLRAQLPRDAAARTRAAHAAWLDAFGRSPTDAELRAESALPLTYTERLQRHVARLAAQPAEFRDVLQRAYQLVVHRDAYAEEVDYWHPHGALSFVALVACLEDWARRNQPGLMITAGTPTVPLRSRAVCLVPLSPAIAAEARPLVGSLDVHSRVLAVGARSLRTPGNMHLALVGRD
ncbi:MAG: hypothetical protein KF715_16310 [Candidatus Didemnitutus sp.]|nr:hypothetical protein [Candidatus Didemnitutus sp.]